MQTTRSTLTKPTRQTKITNRLYRLAGLKERGHIKRAYILEKYYVITFSVPLERLRELRH